MVLSSMMAKLTIFLQSDLGLVVAVCKFDPDSDANCFDTNCQFIDLNSDLR